MTVLTDLLHRLRSLVRRRTVERDLDDELSVGLAIGANAAIFSIVDAVLVRPLPFPDAETHLSSPHRCSR